MSVVDEEKVEKASRADESRSLASGPMGWLPRKLGEGRAFLAEVKSELKKVTWPGRSEVYSTTLVVIATSIFFGFYLWGLDLAMSRVLSLVLKR
jgi:preprotein translocase subunit SecE